MIFRKKSAVEQERGTLHRYAPSSAMGAWTNFRSPTIDDTMTLFNDVNLLFGHSPMVRAPHPPTGSTVQRWKTWGPRLQKAARWGTVVFLVLILAWFALATLSAVNLPQTMGVRSLLIVALPLLFGLKKLGMAMQQQSKVLSKDDYLQLNRACTGGVFAEYFNVVQALQQRRFHQVDRAVIARLEEGWDGPRTYYPSAQDEVWRLLFQRRYGLPKIVFSD